jgi:hypothetical protein
VLNGGRDLEKGVMQIDLVKSKTRVRGVRVDEKGITWDARAQKDGAGFTSSIRLKVEKRIEKCPDFRVRVEYVGAAPVVGGFRRGDGTDEGTAALNGGDETPASRATRRKAAIELIPRKLRKYYEWFILLDERSDEEVIAPKAAAPDSPDGKSDVAAAITDLRGDLLSNLYARATGARTGEEVMVFTPEFLQDVAVNTLLVHERVFVDLMKASKVLTGGNPDRKQLLKEVSEAFVAFCHGDLRALDEISDVNAEPDGAMVFLFAEYALTLLQVVDQYGRDGAAALEDEDAQKVAKRLFADRDALDAWTQIAASFILGQRVYMRVYAPRRLDGPANFDDYVRTNFDPTEKFEVEELANLRARYDSLKFAKRGAPLADAELRKLFWRHAMNAVEAFPGYFEDKRSVELGDLMLPAADKPDHAATVPLRGRRGADPSIRRHVRHEVASVLESPTGFASTDKLREIGIDERRLGHLEKMLAAYAGARQVNIEPKALGIDLDSSVDSITLRLHDLLASEAAHSQGV